MSRIKDDNNSDRLIAQDFAFTLFFSTPWILKVVIKISSNYNIPHEANRMHVRTPGPSNEEEVY